MSWGEADNKEPRSLLEWVIILILAMVGVISTLMAFPSMVEGASLLPHDVGSLSANQQPQDSGAIHGQSSFLRLGDNDLIQVGQNFRGESEVDTVDGSVFFLRHGLSSNRGTANFATIKSTHVRPARADIIQRGFNGVLSVLLGVKFWRIDVVDLSAIVEKDINPFSCFGSHHSLQLKEKGEGEGERGLLNSVITIGSYLEPKHLALTAYNRVLVRGVVIANFTTNNSAVASPKLGGCDFFLFISNTFRVSIITFERFSGRQDSPKFHLIPLCVCVSPYTINIHSVYTECKGET